VRLATPVLAVRGVLRLNRASLMLTALARLAILMAFLMHLLAIMLRTRLMHRAHVMPHARAAAQRQRNRQSAARNNRSHPLTPF